MTRPFAFIGFALAFSLILSAFLGGAVSVILAVVCLLAFLVCLCVPKLRRGWMLPVLFILLCFGNLYFTLYQENRVAPVQALAGETALVEGVVRDVKDLESYTLYTIDVHSVALDGAAQEFRTEIRSGNIAAEPYDTVQMTVYFYPIEDETAVSRRTYVFGYAYDGDVVDTPESRPFFYRIHQMRTWMRGTIRTALPGDEGDVLTAMVLGDKDWLDSGLKQAFTDAGVYHLFAVSGLHVSIWSSLIYLMLRRAKLGRKLSGLGGIGFVLFYMALTAFPESVMRAGIMMCLYFAGQMFLREPDGLNSLGLAVTVLLLSDPMSVYSVSLMLSVCASLGILTLGTRLSQWGRARLAGRKFGRFLQYPMELVMVSLAVNLYTLPVVFLYFRRISVTGIGANVFFIPLATVTMILAALIPLLSFLPVLMNPAVFAAGLGAKAMIGAAQWCASLPFAVVSMQEAYFLFWLCGSIALLALGFLMRRNASLVKLTAALSAGILLVSGASYTAMNWNILNVYVLDVGNATAVVAVLKREAVIIGAGGDYTAVSRVQDVLEREGVSSVRALIIPRLEETESRHVLSMDSRFAIDYIILPEESEDYAGANAEIRTASQITVDLGMDFRVEYQYDASGAWTTIWYGAGAVLVSPLSAADYPAAGRFTAAVSRQGTLDSVSAGVYLVSGDEFSAAKAQDKALEGWSAQATAGQGSIRLKVDSRGNYSYRRLLD